MIEPGNPGLSSAITDGEKDDGPLLFALLLNNQNNNNSHPNAQQGNPAPDTLDSRYAVRELLKASTESEESPHGSPFPALPTGSNNKNAQTMRNGEGYIKSEGTNENDPISDIFDSRQVVQGLLKPSLELVDDGPLFLALLMGNNNLNAAAQEGAKHPELRPISDTLNAREAVQELKSSHEQTAPILKMRGVRDEAPPCRLSNEQLQSWRDNGYLVVPDAISKEIVAQLLNSVHEAAEMLATKGHKRVREHGYGYGQDNYISAVGRVLVVPSKVARQPGVEPLQRIQRLGCGLHRAMPPFRKAVMSATHTEMAKALGYTDPRVIQSLVIVKAAQVGAKVVPHQDGCSGFTDPPSCTTFWYALEDATKENGCLAVAPGSHRVEPVRRRCRQDAKGLPEFVDLETPVAADLGGVSANAAKPARNEHGELLYKELEVKAGSLILMHGNLMHTSEANTSGKSRVAFNFGVVEGTHEWLFDNYLQPYDGETEFEKLHVC